MQCREHISGRSDQPALAGQADHGGGAGHAEAELLGHRPPGTLIDQQQRRFAAAQGQADAGRLPSSRSGSTGSVVSTEVACNQPAARACSIGVSVSG